MTQTTQVIRGQWRGRVEKKVNAALAQGWRLQGTIAQERGFNGSTRYAATMVYDPQSQPAPAVAMQTSDYSRGWREGQASLVKALMDGTLTVEQAAINLWRASA